MASFNEDSLKKKLDDLNMSQQSIQTVSLWLIHHKKHAHTVVNVWYRELIAATDSRKLTFMYLANDVIQNSKKKGPEYNKEFANKLGKVFEHLGGIRLDEKSVHGLNRLLTVWGERNVFDHEKVKLFKKNLNKGLKIKEGGGKKRQHGSKHKKESSKKQRKESVESTESSRLRKDSEGDLSPQTTPPPSDPPEPEQLIEALQELESAATSDAVVREKIASLPDEVSDVSLLTKLQDLNAARALSKKVEDAMAMLETYNKRLSEEMEARKMVARMLHDYITYQKDLLAQAEETLEEHRQKHNKVKKVRDELKAHLQNLPDISKLPSIRTGSLAPLPSAGDLFT
ncbi:regulation of nuclear pre-mRNA domain-containing protein 1B-like isoform X2 [Portunus trituberculatus]|uniref:regulation of nuclear pre-mRNA domain-containing protein 1B-like isoform X2 n=1 Tax=Portunus trituberculatus TaxID=210409 RepID=UPI001E1CEB39|nr:regulation of nuclear pre-mRNA domain-containing protein 1B-like isoform X2 [Portunus trituberculatus]